MKKKEMKRIIAGEIKATPEDELTKESVLMVLLNMGAKIGPAMAAITKAFKEAGIITVTSNTALKNVKDELSGMDETAFDGMSYRDMHIMAETLNDRHEVNDDPEKGQASCMKAIAARMKELNVPVPKKIHIGEVKALTIDYFGECDDNGDTPNVDSLATYLIENVEGAGDDATDDVKAKLRVTAGTYFNFANLLWTHTSIDELN